MEKVMKKLTDSVVDKISMDFLRNQVLKNAYGNDDTVIARLDPRILLAWYVFFALAPLVCRQPGISPGLFPAGCCDYDYGQSRRPGALPFPPWSFFPDRLSVCGLSAFRRKCRDHPASSGSYFKGGYGISGVYYCVLRPGSGPAV